MEDISNTDSVRRNILKPWTKETLIKTSRCSNLMLGYQTLVNLYKCMASQCSFSTSDGTQMNKHLCAHKVTEDVLTCPYCSYRAGPLPRLLVSHVETAHGECMYQCNSCFYRALQVAHVVYHQYNHHKGSEPVVIHLQRQRQPKKDFLDQVSLSFKKVRNTLKCTVCRCSFASIPLYAAHVKTHAGKSIECPVCSAGVEKRMVQVHLINHRLDNLKCLYCNAEFNSKGSMQRHLSDVHYEKPVYCSMKMKRFNRQYDLYVLENLGVNLPAFRMLVDNIQCDVKATQPQQSVAVCSTVTKTDQAVPPAILNVQGSGSAIPEQKSQSSTAPIDSGDEVTIVTIDNSGKVDTAPVSLRGSVCSKETMPLPTESHKSASSSIDSESSITPSVSLRVKDIRMIKKDVTIFPLERKRNASVSYKRVKIDESGAGPSGLNLPSTSKASVSRGATSVTLMPNHKTNTLTKPNSTRCTNPDSMTKLTGEDDDDDEDDNDADSNEVETGDYQEEVDYFKIRNSFSRGSPNLPSNIRFHLDGFKKKIDIYYKCLEKLVSCRTFTGTDVYVCGIVGCFERFPLLNELARHMAKCGTGEKICKYCNIRLTERSYLMHLNIHRLEKFVCFLCTYSHFLLGEVVMHMEHAHSCNALQLSYAHPEKNNLLQDIVVLIPVELRHADKEKRIDNTINTGSKSCVVDKLGPKRILSSQLYKCGFCLAVLPSKLAFEKHILLCEMKIYHVYSCAHCDFVLEDWLQQMHKIVQHLYFHGENLYRCSSCKVAHYLRHAISEHVKNDCKEGTVETVRESSKYWRCLICAYSSNFHQAVMEHMQNKHNLPGERYMCSLCDERVTLTSEVQGHGRDVHPGIKVTWIEFYRAVLKTNRIEMLTLSPERDDAVTAEQGSTPTIPLANDNNIKVELSDSPPISSSNIKAELPDSPLCEEQTTTRSQLNEGTVEAAASKVDRSNDEESVASDVPEACQNIANDAVAVVATIVKKEKSSTTSASPTLLDQSTGQQRIFLNTSPGSSARRSRRVALKMSALSQWVESVTFFCLSCETCHESFADLENHETNPLADDSGAKRLCKAEQRRFRLRVKVRCFHCNEKDTCAALRAHCQEKHSEKVFACIDYWDSFKCGLCSYRNGSGDERSFGHHFQTNHETSCNVYIDYGQVTEPFLEWVTSLGSKEPASGAGKKVLHYICHFCGETDASESAMGLHVAKHCAPFSCVQCAEKFKTLRALYNHSLTVHNLENFKVLPMCSDEYGEQLLEVLMLFENGLVLSKREAQHTSVGSLEVLQAGFHSYQEQEQASDLGR